MLTFPALAYITRYIWNDEHICIFPTANIMPAINLNYEGVWNQLNWSLNWSLRNVKSNLLQMFHEIIS